MRHIRVLILTGEVTISYSSYGYQEEVLLGNPCNWKPPADSSIDADGGPFALARSLASKSPLQEKSELSGMHFTVSTQGANTDLMTGVIRISHALKIKVEYESYAGDGKTEVSVMQVPVTILGASSRRPESWQQGLPRRQASDGAVHVPKLSRMRNASEPVELLSRKMNLLSANQNYPVKAMNSAPQRARRNSSVWGKPSIESNGDRRKMNSPSPHRQVESGRWTLDEEGVYQFDTDVKGQRPPTPPSDDDLPSSTAIKSNTTKALKTLGIISETEASTVGGGAVQGNTKALKVLGLTNNSPPGTPSKLFCDEKMVTNSMSQEGPAFLNGTVGTNNTLKRITRNSDGFFVLPEHGVPVAHPDLARSFGAYSDSPIAESLRESGKWELGGDGVYTFV